MNFYKEPKNENLLRNVNEHFKEAFRCKGSIKDHFFSQILFWFFLIDFIF